MPVGIWVLNQTLSLFIFGDCVINQVTLKGNSGGALFSRIYLAIDK